MKSIAPLLLAVLCSGCTFSVEFLKLDENTCAADPKHAPACVVGVAVFAKERF